jgi:Ras-related protein Rab-2A
MEYLYLFKVIIVGDSGVGKSSITQKLMNNTFSPNKEMTIGVDFATKIIKINDNNIKLHIWDTAGQENFKCVAKSFYRDAIAVIICYDINKYDSFKHVMNWYHEVVQHNESPLVMLIGTKTDLEKRQVKIDEGKKLAEENGWLFAEVTCKHTYDKSVENSIGLLCRTIYDSIKTGEIDLNVKKGIKVGFADESPKRPEPRGCCDI